MQKTKIVIFLNEHPNWRIWLFIQRLVSNPKLKVIVFQFKIWNQDQWSMSRLFLGIHDVFLPNKDTLNEKSLGARIFHFSHRRKDLNRARFILKTFEANLGVILGKTFPLENLIKIPTLGTIKLNKSPIEYQGSVGIKKFLATTVYWESGKPTVRKLIDIRHIPMEPYETSASLKVKAEIYGFELLGVVIRKIAYGTELPGLVSISNFRELKQSPYLRKKFLGSNLKQWSEEVLGIFGISTIKKLLITGFRTMRAALCLLVFPFLVMKRKRLEKRGEAPIIILYYHGVGNDASNWMTLPMEEFDQQIHYLKSYAEIISLDEALYRLKAKKSYKTSIVLTFDDGYKSLHDNVLPYLRHHKIPATFFVCTGNTIRSKQLKHDVSKGFHDASLMNLEEVRKCAEQGITIGAHGLYHENMAELNPSDLKRAMVQSADILSQKIKRRIRFFAFPFGHKSTMSALALEVGKSRYQAIFSAYGGYNLPSNSQKNHFQRFANPTDLFSLICIVNGLHRLRPFYTDEEGSKVA